MHDTVMEYLEPWSHRLCYVEEIIDIGGRDINGTPQELWPNAKWTVVDLYPGPGVDVVGDFREYVHPHPVDLIICTEVFEHTPVWPDLIEAARKNLTPHGILLLTMATGRRKPHSAIDGNPIRPNEYYANVEPLILQHQLQRHFTHVEIDVKKDDLRAYAQTVATYECCGEVFVGEDILKHSCERLINEQSTRRKRRPSR